MPNFIDLTGQRFGRLTVIKRAPDHFTKSGTRITMWNCICDCGKEKDVTANALRKGVTRSCGCYSNEVKSKLLSERNTVNAKLYGVSHERLFPVWSAIRRRCYSTNDDFYSIYGGRGIVMCEEWKNNYPAFRNWALSSGWKEGLSIDRIDNNGPYCPENCRWATAKEQANNRRSNRRFSAFGETLNIQQWSERLGIPYNRLRYRLVQRGMSVQGAMEDLGMAVMVT